MPGVRIVMKPAGPDVARLQFLESELQHAARCFGGVTLLPVWLAVPVAEFQFAFVEMQSAAAHIGAVAFAGDAELKGFTFGSAFVEMRDPGDGIALRVGMRHR